jgi:hypothetical protein
MASAQQRASAKERTPNLQQSEKLSGGKLTIMVYLIIFMSMKNTNPNGGKVQYIYRKKGLHLKITGNDITREKKR